MKNIRIVGVVGAGTMGSALAQKFAQEGFKVILADREMKFVERGLSSIKSMLNDGVEKKVFYLEQVNQFFSNLKGTDILTDLKICDIIIEAIFEDFNAKSELFKILSEIVPAETILATNTSSFSVTELSSSVKNPERFVGLHYFYHAAKNRLVEIIPGEKTSDETTKAAYRFSVLSGKDPIYTKDAYGFAVNRFFVPWLNESVRLVEEGISIDRVEHYCKKILGIDMGPFALMNATGVPIAYHAEKTLELFGSLYTPAPMLKQYAEQKLNWKYEELGKLHVGITHPLVETTIHDRILGIIFFICSQILEEKVCTAIDLNKGAKIGLKWKKGPIDLMREKGINDVNRLVSGIAKRYNISMPKVNEESWKMEFVTLEKSGDKAIITMNRPEDLNALNEEVVKQLDEKFSEAENDSSVKIIFIIGSGKAFVAGADIKFFVKNIKNNSLNKIVDFTSYGQSVFEKIDKSKKKVVAILNGMALGGGLELALCADVILAVPKTAIAFPETGIGIYPGLGGTQRSAKRVGKGLAKYLILTGKMLNANEASEIGLIDAIISQEEVFEILEGEKSIPEIRMKELSSKWKATSDLYSKNNFKQIISGNYSNGNLEKEEVAKLGKTMSYKAPVAMQIAEDLIDQAKGSLSELEKLTTIFSTSDAFKGLTNIGKKIEYEGK